MQVIRYVLVILALSAAEFVLLGVIAVGLVSEAVCVLVGPIFIPFFVVPNLEWLFWGWFKAFIQYAYPVVANAFIFVRQSCVSIPSWRSKSASMVMIMAKSDCEEKQRLLVAYDKASSELSDAVAALRKNEGTTGKQEYDSLCRASEDAHMETEQARLAFERHNQDHKC